MFNYVVYREPPTQVPPGQVAVWLSPEVDGPTLMAQASGGARWFLASLTPRGFLSRYGAVGSDVATVTERNRYIALGVEGTAPLPETPVRDILDPGEMDVEYI